MQLKHIIILQNKIDLISESAAQNQHEAIQVRRFGPHRTFVHPSAHATCISSPLLRRHLCNCDVCRQCCRTQVEAFICRTRDPHWHLSLCLLHRRSLEADPCVDRLICVPWQAFIAGTIAADAPVVPISAQLKYNIDAVCEYLVKKIPVPVRCLRPQLVSHVQPQSPNPNPDTHCSLKNASNENKPRPHFDCKPVQSFMSKCIVSPAQRRNPRFNLLLRRTGTLRRRRR